MKAPRKFVWVALAALVALAGAPGAHAQAPSPRLTLADAEKIIAAVQSRATEMNLRVSIAVVDVRGDLIALARMPGAGANTPDTAIGKAMMSAIYGQPSGALVQRATSPVTQGLNDASGGRLRFIQGGVPVVRGGFTVGAVAASGASSQQDEEISRSGLSAAP
jgi:glc operon protein GlcG